MERIWLVPVLVSILIIGGSGLTQQAFATQDFAVAIEKNCDALVVQVPDNSADPIDCIISVENTGGVTLTNCKVLDDLTGVLNIPLTLNPGHSLSSLGCLV